MKRISQTQFLAAAKDAIEEPFEYAIALNGGTIRSSKNIMYFPETEQYDIYNEIDDSSETLTEEELLNGNSSTSKALRQNAIIIYE